jgi:hypothetical protein
LCVAGHDAFFVTRIDEDRFAVVSVFQTDVIRNQKAKDIVERKSSFLILEEPNIRIELGFCFERKRAFFSIALFFEIDADESEKSKVSARCGSSLKRFGLLFLGDGVIVVDRTLSDDDVSMS